MSFTCLCFNDTDVNTHNTECSDNGYPKRNLYISKSVHYSHVRFTTLQKKPFQVFLLVDNNVGTLGGTTSK
jgi:hypothetical protein